MVSTLYNLTKFLLTQRIFLIEGLCTVVLAVGLYFVLPNRVDDCKWLSSEEKTAIWERKSAGTAADPLARKFEWHYLTECLKGMGMPVVFGRGANHLRL
jgi:hypothetical protein